MEKDARIYVAGHTGLAGSAITRELKRQGYRNLLAATHDELDLRNQKDTEAFFEREKPEYVFVAAATVGGVLANDSLPGKFLYDNLTISVNVIHSAFQAGVKKLLYLGSGCIYPRLAEQPVKEEALLTGALEKTNEAYAIAKIAGVKMCEYYNKQYKTSFISCMPCNTYGPGDNYDLNGGHVVPAMIRKFYEAKESRAPEVVIWGSGKPVREFIYIDDIADAAVFLMRNYSGNETVNIGTGTEYTIAGLAEVIKEAAGYEGNIAYDLTKPDGAPRKLLDSSKLFEMGWRPSVSFADGIRRTLEDYVKNRDKYNG